MKFSSIADYRNTGFKEFVFYYGTTITLRFQQDNLITINYVYYPRKSYNTFTGEYHKI
jgi:hypothetical protein